MSKNIKMIFITLMMSSSLLGQLLEDNILQIGESHRRVTYGYEKGWPIEGGGYLYSMLNLRTQKVEMLTKIDSSLTVVKDFDLNYELNEREFKSLGLLNDGDDVICISGNWDKDNDLVEFYYRFVDSDSLEYKSEPVLFHSMNFEGYVGNKKLRNFELTISSSGEYFAISGFSEASKRDHTSMQFSINLLKNLKLLLLNWRKK